MPNESMPTLNYDSSSLNEDYDEQDIEIHRNIKSALFAKPIANKSGGAIRIRPNTSVIKNRPSVLDYYAKSDAPTTIIKQRGASTLSSFTTSTSSSNLPPSSSSPLILPSFHQMKSGGEYGGNHPSLGSHHHDSQGDEEDDVLLSPSKIPIGLDFQANNSSDKIDETFEFLDEDSYKY